MQKVFIDTGAWYSYIKPDDPDHSRVLAFLKNIAAEVVTTNYIFDETITLVRSRLGYSLAERVGRIIREAQEVPLVWVTPLDEEHAWQLFLKRRDKAYSFTDCTSFILMRRLKIQHCLSTDEHFCQEGFTVVI